MVEAAIAVTARSDFTVLPPAFDLADFSAIMFKSLTLGALTVRREREIFGFTGECDGRRTEKYR
jgi:hypothetical protein